MKKLRPVVYFALGICLAGVAIGLGPILAMREFYLRATIAFIGGFVAGWTTPDLRRD